VPERTLQQPELIQGFLRATQRGAAFTTEHPEDAFEVLCQAKPQLRTPMYQKIFTHSLPFFSRSLHNIDRDWDKVGRYTKHLNIIDKDFDISQCYTNHFLPQTPHSDIEPIACCIKE
jgi:ABC-type nitrate/sulfonate/bicarbonate transport system substrate-binding protein